MNYSNGIILDVTFEQLESTARAMIGIPYVHIGRDPEQGLDCFGVVIDFYRRLGIKIIDFVEYLEEWWRRDDLFNDHADSFDEIDRPTVGGVVSMKIAHSLVPNHLAVVLPQMYLLNTSRSVGVHKLRLFSIRKLICKSYTCKGMMVHA